MTLREAIESGKDYKRKSEESWYTVDFRTQYTKAEVLADDWETFKEPEVYEIECEWDENAWGKINPKSYSNAFEKVIYGLSGKKTKLRIEVVED